MDALIDYWSQAQLYFPAVLGKSGITKLQAMHLVLQYVLRKPEAGGEFKQGMSD